MYFIGNTADGHELLLCSKISILSVLNSIRRVGDTRILQRTTECFKEGVDDVYLKPKKILSFQKLRLNNEIQSSSKALEHKIVHLAGIIDSDVNNEKSYCFI